MNNQEYENKKRECWEEYLKIHGRAYCYTTFSYAFDRAYALGKQEGPSKNSSEIKRELSKNSSEIKRELSKNSSESNPAEPTENKADEIADKAINPIEEYFDNIIKDGFREHNRLHIASIIMLGLLASGKEKHPVRRAMDLADALIAECEKD